MSNHWEIEPRVPAGQPGGGQWTDGGPAIQRAASDLNRGLEIAFAPYRSRAVNSDQEDSEIRARPEFQIFQKAVAEAAEGLGIEIFDKLDTWGGYVDSETKIPVQEVSNVIHINAGHEKAELLAAILGSAAPELQDSVLVATYDENGDGMEYTIKTGNFENAKKAISRLDANGIQYFTINRKNGEIILLDTDNSIHENVLNFITDLKNRGLYENAEFARTRATFVTFEDYPRIIGKSRIEARTEKGFDIDAFIKKTKESYAKAQIGPKQ